MSSFLSGPEDPSYRTQEDFSSKTKATLLGGGVGAVAGTALVGAPLAFATGALWVKGQAHWKADEWVHKYQNPWGDAAIEFMNTLWNDRKAGTLTYEGAQSRLNTFESNVNDLLDQATLFEGKGGDQAKVIKQFRAKMDPIIDTWRKDIQGQIDALKPPDPLEGVSETEPPTMASILEKTGETPAGKAQGAADQARKRLLALQGRQSTILTGDKDVAGTGLEEKTLLGR